MSNIVAIEDLSPNKDHMLRVEWNLGKRCNYNCSYCGNDLHDNTSDFMPVDVFRATIDKINQARQDKRCKIAFTGGEPFVHPYFIDMLKYCNDLGIQCSVTTNGSAPVKIYKKAMPYLSYVVVSYHFEFGYHEKIIDHIVAIRKMSRDMHVHIMFLPGHLEQCKEIMKIMTDNDIKYVIRRIRPRINPERTAWHKPYADGMLGFAPTNKEISDLEDQYYSNEELAWLKEVS